LNDALRAILIDGAGPRAIAAPVGILAGYALLSFAVALRIFRWR
jgi:ABC-2 type transport system permease protein